MTNDLAKSEAAANAVGDTLEAWAGSLTERQLSAALNEFRNRKYAAAVYDADTMNELFVVNDLPRARAWFDENYEVIEEVMCEAACEHMRRELDALDLLHTEDEQ